jgi:hypothetical protein
MAKMKVRYKGLSTYRILQAKQLEEDHGIVLAEHAPVPPGVVRRMQQDLAGIDVDVKTDLVWARSNGWSLVLDVSPELEDVLRAQGHFSLSAVNDDGTEQVVAAATALHDDPSQVVVHDDETGTQTQAVPSTEGVAPATGKAASAKTARQT